MAKPEVYVSLSFHTVNTVIGHISNKGLRTSCPALSSLLYKDGCSQAPQNHVFAWTDFTLYRTFYGIIYVNFNTSKTP